MLIWNKLICLVLRILGELISICTLLTRTEGKGKTGNGSEGRKRACQQEGRKTHTVHFHSEQNWTGDIERPLKTLLQGAYQR